MRCWPAAIVCAIAAAVVVVGPAPGLAGPATGGAAVLAIKSLRVGFDGRYKVGFLTPVTVVLHSTGARWEGSLELTTADGDGVLARVVSPADHPVVVPAGGETSVTLYVKFGRLASQLTIVARDAAGHETLRRQITSGATETELNYADALLSTDQLLLSLGPTPGLEGLRRLARGESERGGLHLVRLADAHALPLRWYGYDGVDALVITLADLDAWRTLAADTAQGQALRAWIDHGGLLLLCGGSEAQAALSPEMPLAGLAPGPFGGLVEMRLWSALEAYVAADEALPGASGANPPTALVPRLETYEGAVELREADLPLVVRTAHGWGQVVFLALDPASAPLAQWPGLPRLWARLLNQPVRAAEPAAGKANDGRVNWLGIDDLSGQLRGALDQFPQVKLMPFWLVGLLLLAYLLLIGPVDYFLVHRVFQRSTLTWVTFPLIVVAMSVGTLVFANWTKGKALRVNQLDLLDVDQAGGRLRGTTWATVFSPRPTTYDVTLMPGGTPANERPLVSWFGLPGPALGGLHSPGLASSRWNDAYDASPEAGRLQGVPIQIWSSKSLVARWQQPAPMRLEGTISTGIDQVPAGTLTNATGQTLEHCLLAVGRWGLTLDRPWEPGETIDLEDPAGRFQRTELVTRLTDRVMVFDEQRREFVRQARPYDQASFDREAVLKQMMFFQAAGGESYTRLTHRYQAFVDLSRQLAAHRAILVARISADVGPTLGLGAEPCRPENLQHDTMVRFLLPVSEGDTAAAGR